MPCNVHCCGLNLKKNINTDGRSNTPQYWQFGLTITAKRTVAIGIGRKDRGGPGETTVGSALFFRDDGGGGANDAGRERRQEDDKRGIIE